jgi:hypothetical protein
MKARIYSSIDAHSLLHSLHEAAMTSPKRFAVELANHGASTHHGALRVLDRAADPSTSATISQLDDHFLVAQLDEAEATDPITARRRLETLLTEIVTQYNNSTKPGLAPDDQAVIVFEDDVKNT